MNDWTFSYEGLTLGQGTVYRVLSVEGFGMPDVRSNDQARSQADGDFLGVDAYASRTITFAIAITTTTNATRQAALAALQTAFTRRATTEAPLSFQIPGNPTQRINCRPRRADWKLTPLFGHGPVVDCLIQLQATDPRVYADTLSTSSTSLQSTGDGFTFPFTFPFAFGTAAAGGVFTLTNAGLFPAPVEFTIAGPVTNPRIELVETGQTLASSLVLYGGDSLALDSGQRTVILNDTASRRSALAPGSQFFDLAPGSNHVRFLADTFEAGATLTASWRSSWIAP